MVLKIILKIYDIVLDITEKFEYLNLNYDTISFTTELIKNISIQFNNKFDILKKLIK